jgi:hypothetical protein
MSSKRLFPAQLEGHVRASTTYDFKKFVLFFFCKVMILFHLSISILINLHTRIKAIHGHLRSLDEYDFAWSRRKIRLIEDNAKCRYLKIGL